MALTQAEEDLLQSDVHVILTLKQMYQLSNALQFRANSGEVPNWTERDCSLARVLFLQAEKLFEE